jgi:hypothetical protein
MYHGIRDVRESTRGLGEDLEAFNFSLTTVLNMDHGSGHSRMVPQLDALKYIHTNLYDQEMSFAASNQYIHINFHVPVVLLAM